MTEFARKPSKLQQWWRRFWPAFRCCLRDLWHGVLPGVTPDPCPLLADPDFWNGIVLQPAMPETEPQAIPLPDPEPVSEPKSGLTLQLGDNGTGHVFYNGEELPWVKGVDVIVRPLEPVAVTIYLGAREGVHIESTNAALDFVIEPRPVVPAREDTDAK